MVLLHQIIRRLLQTKFDMAAEQRPVDSVQAIRQAMHQNPMQESNGCFPIFTQRTVSLSVSNRSHR